MATPVIHIALLGPPYFIPSADPRAFHQDAAEGRLSALQNKLFLMPPKQRTQAVNLVLTIPPYVGHTPLLAVLNSSVFSQALKSEDKETLERFRDILILLAREGANLIAASSNYNGSLLHCVAAWATLPGQREMHSLLGSLRDLLLGKDPATQRIFTADERLAILSCRQRCEDKDLTPLELIFTYQTSLEAIEVVKILMEMGDGVIPPSDLDALMRIALTKLEMLSKNYAGPHPAAYFGVNPELVNSLLHYINLCLMHGASPTPFLDSFICANKDAVMNCIKPCAPALNDEAPSEDDPLIQERDYQSLRKTLAQVYQQATAAEETHRQMTALCRTISPHMALDEDLPERIFLPSGWAGIRVSLKILSALEQATNARQGTKHRRGS